MANIKYVKLTGSGDGTFSDRLVGDQRTEGDAQLTNNNFIYVSPNPVYDDKKFDNGEFSEPLNREKLSETGTTEELIENVKPKNEILFSSSNERVKLAVTNIVNTFPGALRSIPQDLEGEKLYNLREFEYNPRTNTTTFIVDTRSIRNPLNVIYHSDRQPIEPEDFSKIKYFNVNFKSYQAVIKGEKFKIVGATLPKFNSNDPITLEVEGKVDFNTYTRIMDESIYITPTDRQYDIYFAQLDEFENFLLNRGTNPIFTATFEVLEEDVNGNLRINPVEATWPRVDDYNLTVTGYSFNSYVTKINDLSNALDAYKTNLIDRVLTSPTIHEFDTEEQKIGKLLNLYGFTFDKLKSRIDEILYIRNVTYDKVKNVSDDLLPEFEQFVGLAKVGGFDIEDLYEFLINRNSSQFRGLNLQKTKKEKLLEFFRYLVINISYLYKSKGTSKTFRSLFSLMGLPDSFIEVNEFTYKLLNQIQGEKFLDYKELITSDFTTQKDVIYNEESGQYEIVEDTLDIVDETQFPTNYTKQNDILRPTHLNNTSDFYFQQGAGWYRLTDNHKSQVVLDEEKSDLTVTPKVIKTKFDDFTYGEKYFDSYRKLLGQNVGWNFETQIDNIQAKPTPEKDILNRKNIEIYNNPANGVLTDLLSWYQNNNRLFFNVDVTSNTYQQFNTETYKVGMGIGRGKYGRRYEDLNQTYMEYFKSVDKPFHYEGVYGFASNFSKNWTSLFENFVPTTTIWTGGNKIDNHNFHKQKFNWTDPHCIDVLDIDIPTEEKLKEYLVEHIDEYKNHPDCYGRQYVYANWYYHLKINDDVLTNDGWDFLFTTYESESCDVLLTPAGFHNADEFENKINLTCGFENVINCVGDSCIIGDKIAEDLSDFNKEAFKKYVLPYLGICDEQTLMTIINDQEYDFGTTVTDDLNGCDIRELFRNLPDEFQVTTEGIIDPNGTLLSPIEYFELYGYFDAFKVGGVTKEEDCVDCGYKVKLIPINYCGQCFTVNEFEFSLNIRVNEDYDNDLCDYKNYVYDDIPFSLIHVQLEERSINEGSFYGVYVKVQGGHRFDYKNDELPYVLEHDKQYPQQYGERVRYLEDQDRFYVKLQKNLERNIVVYDQAGSYIRIRLRYNDCGDEITSYFSKYKFTFESESGQCDDFDALTMFPACNSDINTNQEEFKFAELPNCQAFMAGSEVYRLIDPLRYPVDKWDDIRIKDEDCEKELTVYTPIMEYRLTGETCNAINATLMGTQCNGNENEVTCQTNIEMLSPYYTRTYKPALLCDLYMTYTIGDYICRDENAFNVEIVPVEEIKDGDYILTADYIERDLSFCEIADYYYGNHNNLYELLPRLNMRRVEGIGGVRIYKFVSINYDEFMLEHDHYVYVRRDGYVGQYRAEEIMVGDEIINFLDFTTTKVEHIANSDYCDGCYKDNYDYKYYLPINEPEAVLSRQSGKTLLLTDWCENHCLPLECTCLEDPFFVCSDDIIVETPVYCSDDVILNLP